MGRPSVAGIRAPGDRPIRVSAGVFAIGRSNEHRHVDRPIPPIVRPCYKGIVPAPVITVIVADDHPLFRDGIVRAVRERPSLKLIGEASDGREALLRISELRPDVAVLDLKLPELDGLQVVKALRRDDVSSRVLMLSAFTEGPVVHELLSAGAAGYLPKSVERTQVCDAIEILGRGGTMLDSSLQDGLLAAIQAQAARAERPWLTDRESEVLVLIADGLSAPGIGARLNLAPGTVKTHLSHLYEKLGVSDRAACVAEAMRRGLLE
jgi:two-component system, NarL family, nitrate/nitrite response regulator NarL